VPLLLADAEIGDVIELDGGSQGETQVKVAAIEATRSVGVVGKRDTIGATLRFVLREHAPELGGEADEGDEAGDEAGDKAAAATAGGGGGACG